MELTAAFVWALIAYGFLSVGVHVVLDHLHRFGGFRGWLRWRTSRPQPKDYVVQVAYDMPLPGQRLLWRDEFDKAAFRHDLKAWRQRGRSIQIVRTSGASAPRRT